MSVNKNVLKNLKNILFSELMFAFIWNFIRKYLKNMESKIVYLCQCSALQKLKGRIFSKLPQIHLSDKLKSIHR